MTMIMTATRTMMDVIFTNNFHFLFRNGCFETYEFKFRECPFDSDSSAEELDYDSQSDTNDIEPEDWDQLTDLPDDHSIIRSESFSPTMEQSRERSNSVSASGLMTSAAASVASALWSWKRQ